VGDEYSRLPISLTILPTYRCSAACQDCCFGSNPRVKGQIPLDMILSYIDQAANLKTIELIVFSGGEAFLLGEDLDTAVSYASKRGLLTRIVTNAYWATNEDFAYKRLKKLKDVGLTELNVSTGDFHQEFVPFRNVINATLASLSLAMPMCIVVESRLGRSFTEKNLLSEDRLRTALQDNTKNKFFKVIESPWMGNYDNETIQQDRSVYLNRDNVYLRKGCDSILANMVVTPYEKLGACCGLPREQIPELNIGSLKEKTLGELYQEAVEDLMKMWLFVEGPERIIAWAATKDPTIDWENKYAHQCDACRALYHDPKIREVIKKYHQEKKADILFRFALINKGKIQLSNWNRS
jgi:HKD family nuclease